MRSKQFSGNQPFNEAEKLVQYPKIFQCLQQSIFWLISFWGFFLPENTTKLFVIDKVFIPIEILSQISYQNNGTPRVSNFLDQKLFAKVQH